MMLQLYLIGMLSLALGNNVLQGPSFENKKKSGKRKAFEEAFEEVKSVTVNDANVSNLNSVVQACVSDSDCVSDEYCTSVGSCVSYDGEYCDFDNVVCGEGDGDCDSDTTCAGDLICQNNACKAYHELDRILGMSGADCCAPPAGSNCSIDTDCAAPYFCTSFGFCADYTGEYCEIPGVICGLGDGDCDADEHCAGGLVCSPVANWNDVHDEVRGDKDGEVCIDPCPNMDCGANGNCVLGICVCTGGYTGDACEIAPDSGSVVDDPHFRGFDGSKYDFQGEAGSVFNIVSDFNYQLNAEFVESPTDHQTFMGKLGFRIRNDSVIVTPSSVEINGKQITRFGQYSLTEGLVVVNVSLTSAKVLSPGFEVTVTKEHTATFVYLNIHTLANADEIHRPHGLLGQTAKFLTNGEEARPVIVPHENKNAKGFIEGTPSDYIVVDGILGTNFAFNRYKPRSRSSKLGSILIKARQEREEASRARHFESQRWHFATAETLYIENVPALSSK